MASKARRSGYLIQGHYSVKRRVKTTTLTLRKTEAEISRNCKQKIYPDGSQEFLFCSRPIFGRAGWEEVDADHEVFRADVSNEKADAAANVDRARRRARAALRDIALCSDFQYFVTLTLDKERVDRYDAGTVFRKLNNWLDNAVRRQGLAYVLVPEHHADGALHFHGLFNDALRRVDSGTLSIPGEKRPRRVRSKKQRAELIAAGARPVWNLPDWGLGFSSAIELYGERGQAVNYVCKYIGKEGEKIGGRWYYSGGKICRPEVRYLDAVFSWEELEEAHHFTVPEIGAKFALLRVPAPQAGGI